MEVRAAVALKAAQPLEITTVQLEGPREGEVMVEIKATGVCHTDEFTLSGADPEGLFPAIRATQGQGLMPDGTSRFSMGSTKIHHYMGTSTFANYTVLPEIAVAKIREDAPFDKVCYIGCGVTTGIGAVINTAKVEPGAKAIVFGLGGIGLNVIQGLRLAGADMIIGVDINSARKDWGERFGMTHFINPRELGKDLVPHLVDMTKSGADQIGGADYTFDCTGNVTVMRQALEACHRGWGQSIVIGVAPAGAEISTRPFQLVTGRVWKGTAFGGARGRTDVPKIVDWYMQGKIQIDPMITHVMPLSEINTAFELMKKGQSIRSVVTF
jgi:S-(hydroxymethyl)glutathione dehydrogenase/alcohol dehydrogenase